MNGCKGRCGLCGVVELGKGRCRKKRIMGKTETLMIEDIIGSRSKYQYGGWNRTTLLYTQNQTTLMLIQSNQLISK